MKNVLTVVIDIDSNQPIQIVKPPDFIPPKTKAEQNAMVIDDMACLCEAICTLIHLADQSGIKPSAASLRDCIKHLTDGFAAADYIAFIPEEHQIP
jgi:hypothetical protein